MPARTAPELSSQIAALQGTHTILDPAPGARPAGEGHFAFLSDIDASSAAALGLTTALAIANSREQGVLPLPSKSDVVGPHIVWHPNEALVNPVYKPEGSGQWAFLTPRASQIAARAFGDQEGFGTTGTERPTADQIFRIREEFREMVVRGEYPHDLTEDVDLVWVPENDGGKVEGEDGSTAAAAAVEEDLGFGIDVVAGLAHEPTNGGINDQTAAPGRPKNYQTRQFVDRRITLDRYSAKVRHVEPHKLWYHNGMKWQRWIRAQEIDWDDAGVIADLNRWREQACRRSGWASRRGKQRDNYTTEQRDYLFEMIVRNNGLAPGRPYKELTENFNKRFKLEGELKRSVGGVQTLISKLCREYEKYGGKQKPRGKGSKGQIAVEDEHQSQAVNCAPREDAPGKDGAKREAMEDAPGGIEGNLSKYERDSERDVSAEIDHEIKN